jgi:MOSC domain-containing protein YiiM
MSGDDKSGAPSVISVQVGRIAPLGRAGVPSGFVKERVAGPVFMDVLGIRGDEQADLRVHGGPDKAVYVYPSEHYPRWSSEFPRHAEQLVGGGFGENLTVAGLDEREVSIGDVFMVGSARVQVTQPRQPCFKLGLRFNDNTLGRAMMQTGRTGWYLRVLEPSNVAAGDEMRLLERPNPAWSIARFNEFVRGREPSEAELKELAVLEGLAGVWVRQISESLRV